MTLIVLADRNAVGVRRLVTVLGEAGFDVYVVARWQDAVLAAPARQADAIVFDPGIADRDAFARAHGHAREHAYIAWAETFSSVGAARLLDAGSDEVLHGGMSAEELVARIRKATRRPGRLATEPVELGALRVDAAEGEVAWGETRIRLSKRERQVLHVLAESAGRTVRREELYRRVWGYTMARGDRTVDVNVKRIRDKLAAAGARVAIETRPGIGYRLDVVTDAPARRSRAPARVGAGRPAA